jgi:hypothetical protein
MSKIFKNVSLCLNCEGSKTTAIISKGSFSKYKIMEKYFLKRLL